MGDCGGQGQELSIQPIWHDMHSSVHWDRPDRRENDHKLRCPPSQGKREPKAKSDLEIGKHSKTGPPNPSNELDFDEHRAKD